MKWRIDVNESHHRQSSVRIPNRGPLSAVGLDYARREVGLTAHFPFLAADVTGDNIIFNLDGVFLERLAV